MLNVTQIPALRVPFIDPNTGLISREWYRFLLNLFTLTGSGNNQISLDDVQVGPPAGQPQNLVELALAQAFGLTPPVQPISSPDYFNDTPAVPLVQPVANFGIEPPLVPFVIDSSGAGTVTSVNATVPSFLDVAGVPITTTGTIAISYSGIPLPVANGGTGATSLSGAGIPTLSGNNTFTGQNIFSGPSNYFRALAFTTSDGGSGNNAYFGENSAYATIGGVNGLVVASGSTFPGTGRYVGDSISWRPFVDATYSCGTGVQRWSSMHTVNMHVDGTYIGGTWNGNVIGTAYGGTGASSLAAAGIPTLSANNTFTGQNIFSGPSNYFRALAFTTSDGGSGNNAYFGENSAYATIGGVNGVVLASGSSFPGTGRYVGDSISWRPFVDATYSCGTGTQRWSSMHTINLDVSGTVTNGTWNGSVIGTAYGGTGASSLSAAGIPTLSANNTFTGQNIFSGPSNYFRALAFTTSDGGSGNNAYFGENSAYATIGGVNGLVVASGSTFPGTGRYVGDSISWRPFVDATYSCGTGTQRWSSMHTINLAISGTVTSGTWNGSAIGTAYGGTGATSLTGAGIVTTTDAQTISGAKSFTSYTSQFRGITYATTDGASASNAYLGEDSAYAVVGGANGVVLASGASYPGTPRYVGDSVSFRPYADASYSLGTGPQRWTAVYAVNGTIQTSDGNEKQQIEELDAAELAVAKRIKGLIRKFKFNDSVAEKGDGARIHVGVIAQDVHDAFVAEGLDPYKYGLFCSDTWNTLDGTSKTRLGVRYEELLAFVIAAL
jgi:hypothetical protein